MVDADVLTTRERYDAMIKTMIGIELRELGSRKRRNTFYRTSDAGWTLIDFQASQFGTRDDVSFTINLGISFIELQPTDQGPPSLGRAHVNQRIGRLLRDDGNFWWQLDPASAFEVTAAEINLVINETAIPWLERRAVLDELLAGAHVDPGFVEPWHLRRLAVLAERVDRRDLSAELRKLASAATS